MVDVTTDKRTEIGVRLFDDWFDDGRGTLLAFRTEGVRAFHDAPAVVAAFFDLVDVLPEILADVATPQVAVLGVKAERPRLAQAVRPDLAASALGLHKGIVLGDAVRLVLGGMIDVDAENRGKDVADVLTGFKLVGDAAAVAAADIEEPIRPELEAATVVAARGPLEDDLFAG